MDIVLDLEWNQSALGKEGMVPDLPFEIIEIGAVKLNYDGDIVDEFHRVIRPVVYEKMHFRIQELVKIGIDELRKDGELFADACGAFLEWAFREEAECGEKPMFCTWGELDLYHLQNNMQYFNVPSPFPYPFLYYDVQRLYGRQFYNDSREIRPLDEAVKDLGLESGKAFHRALEDARYTAMVFQRIDRKAMESYVSIDYFRIPRTREEEISLVFPTYTKYVSRAFPNRSVAFRETGATELYCPRCNRLLRRQIDWFTASVRQYHALGQCPAHGPAWGKIRVKKTENGSVYLVKTTRRASADQIAELREREEISRKRRAERNRRRKRK